MSALFFCFEGVLSVLKEIWLVSGPQTLSSGNSEFCSFFQLEGRVSAIE